jgi:hypothetical protein
LVDSLNRSRNDQAYVNGALAELRAKLEATAQARAAASSATFLMLQSDVGTIEAYASFTRDYSQIALETNEQVAQVETGVKLATSLGLAVGGAYFGNPEITVGALVSLGSVALDLALAEKKAPSVDEQTFDQLVQLRQQVEQMRQEMNVRFDRIDRQLNTMYTQIGVGFAAIGEDIGDLTADVGVLVLDMAVARSELRGLEASLYGVANSVLLQDLTFETDLALDFRADELGDFPYRDLDTNFVTASTIFYNYATSVATDPVFAGPLPDGVTIDNVNDIMAAGYSTTQFINDLAALPQAFGLGTLAPAALVGIEPWSQASAAYAQLARENPWYFAYRNGGGAADELAEIIRDGDRVVDFIEAVRETEADGSSPLFDALVQNYKGAVTEFQSAVDASIVEFLPDAFKNGAYKLNLWASSPQRDLINVTGRIQTLVDADGGSAQPFPVPFTTYRGWEMFTDANSPDQVALLQTAYLIDKAKAGPLVEVRPVFESTFVLASKTDGKYWFRARIENGRTNVYGNPRTSRSFYYYAQFKYVDPFFGNVTWIPITGYSESEIEAFLLDVWNNTDLKNVFTSSINSTGGPDQVFTSGNNRIRIYRGGGLDPIGQNEVLPELRSYRQAARLDLIDKLLLQPSTDLYRKADGLDQAAALLNAYVSIGMPNELNDSQVLRSALRAAPGASELGLGSADVIKLIDQMDQADSNSQAWANQSFNVTRIDDILNSRIDVVAQEIERGLGAGRPAVAPAYVTWVLSELKHLQETATELAIDDTYVVPSGGVLSTTIDNGLLANDLDQPELVISVDLEYASDPGYIAPMNGTVELNADGSFTYQPAPGFVGTDSFTYRSTATIPDTISPVLSEPARVVVIVDEGNATSWSGYPVDPLGWVDTGSWMAWLNVREAPWIWTASLSTWVYIDESVVSNSGGWVYIPKFDIYQGGGASGDTWAGYPANPQGWVNTESWMAWLNVLEAPWIWSASLSTWVYIDESVVSDSGSWVYIPKI